MSLSVKDATGASQTINTLPALGLAGAAASLPVVLASDGAHAKAADIAQVVTALGSLSVGITGTAAVTQSGAWTVGLVTGATVALAGGNTVAIKVDGSAVTQPVSASVLPLPTGASTAAAQATGNTSLGSIDTKTPALTGGRVPVDGSGVTQPVSAAALPLPTGAATAAKQPALGTAGTASADVLTVQGVAGGTPQAADTVVRSTSTSRSGAITTGGTAQQFAPSNTSRRGFVIQNQSSGDLYINGIGTAAADSSSLKIQAGATYETPVHHVGTGALSIYGATTNQAFYGREY